MHLREASIAQRPQRCAEPVPSDVWRDPPMQTAIGEE
jgi:hypothetical protein